MLNYTRYFNAGALLHNFQDAANLTKQLGIKNAIEYNVNDFLFTIGKNYFVDKINRLQDKLIVGFFTSYSDDIKNNTNIVWSLDNEECTAADGKTSWEVLLEKIASLDGNKANDKYAAGELPTGFDRTKTHTVSWEWKFDKNVTGASDLDTKDNG